MARLRPHLPLALVLLLAFALRLIQLETRTLWYDEAFSVLFAEKGLGAMLYGTITPVAGGAADIHPLLYYGLLNVWMAWFGQGAAVVRLLGVLLGLASIAMLYAIGRRLFGADVGLLAALLAALLPFHVQYSQEARMYGLLALLLMATSYAFLLAWQTAGRARWAWWVLFGVCAGLSMYAQQLAAFYLAALGLVPWLARRRGAMVGMALGVGVALLVYAPWLLVIPAQLAKVNAQYWVTQPDLLTLLRSFYLFLTAYGEADALMGLLGLALVAASLTLAVALSLLGWRIWQRKASVGRRLAWVLWMCLAPIGLMWLVSQIQPVYLERSLIGSAMLLYVLLAWVLLRCGAPRLMRGLLALGVGGAALTGWHTLLNFNTFPYSPIAPLVADVRAEWQAGDAIVHMNKLSMLPATYYARDLTQRYIGDAAGSPEDTLALPTQETLGLLADACIQAAARDATRVWFVVYDRAALQYAALPASPLEQAEAWLATHYTAQATRRYNDIRVTLYDGRRGDPTNQCDEDGGA